MNVHSLRKLGKTLTDTQGSDHYRGGSVEPLDVAISNGMVEDFALVSITKYATRYKKTRNIKDLIKIADYATILCGYHTETATSSVDNLRTRCDNGLNEASVNAESYGLKTVEAKNE